jgi:2'-5' RNA ligase
MAADGGVRPPLGTGRARVFFALWPDAAVRGALADTARRMHRALHGRRTREDSIHLTLAFVGDIGVERLAPLLAPPAEVTTRAFGLTLDEWGCWPRNGIGWVAPSRVPDRLRELVAALEEWLRGAGFDLESRPYSPHITLTRKAHCAPLPDAMPPIEWQVAEFVLVQSQLAQDGSRYRTIGRWPLEF